MLFFSSLKIFLWRIYWRNTNLFQGHEMFVLHRILGTLEFIPVFLSMQTLFVRMVWGRDLMFFSSKWWTNVFKKEDKQIGQDGTRTEGYIERCVCVCVCVCVLYCLSCVWIFTTLWTVAHPAPVSVGVSRQEYWSGFPFPSPGDLPNPGTELGSPALQADSLLSKPPEKPSKLN